MLKKTKYELSKKKPSQNAIKKVSRDKFSSLTVKLFIIGLSLTFLGRGKNRRRRRIEKKLNQVVIIGGIIITH